MLYTTREMRCVLRDLVAHDMQEGYLESVMKEMDFNKAREYRFCLDDLKRQGLLLLTDTTTEVSFKETRDTVICPTNFRPTALGRHYRLYLL